MRTAQAQNFDVQASAPGVVLHAAAHYDLLVWLFTLGRERAFRDSIARLAGLKPGDAVLDIGCGTGSLAIAAKRRVGTTGTVYGVDASREMLARARRKARNVGVDIAFEHGAVQTLPFPDSRFDAVLSTLMLHHLPRKARHECAREVRRVLKPGGRVLAVDFAPPVRKTLLARFHRHGHFSRDHMIALFSEAGLNVVESGAMGRRNLQFVLAIAP